MVNIPKIVLKSQTRLTLNERFTQFGEAQKARIQMLKNDLQTRLVEESFKNGQQDSAELSKKLDRLARDIENPERHQALFSKKSRPKEEHRTREDTEIHEEPIVPEYRPLLYRSGRRNARSRNQRSSKRPVTYGDVLSSDNHEETDVSHWRAEALRGLRPNAEARAQRANQNKYVNPLMRDSDEEGSPTGSSGLSVHSRLGLKQTDKTRNFIPKKRMAGSSYRRAGFSNRGSGQSGGASSSRQAVTKEDLDRELDEYRQKGSVMDIEMSDV